MSLINQALKRAQEAQLAHEQHQSSPTATLQFRPAEAAPRARHFLGLMVPVGWALIAILLLFVIWQAIQKDGSGLATAKTSLPSSAANPARPQNALTPVTPAP